jgi:hypothetical protein
MSCLGKKNEGEHHVPISIRRDNIVDAKLLANLFDSQVERVGLKLFAGHVGENGRGQTHKTGGLVLRNITPSVALLTAPGTIGLRAWFGIAATLEVAIVVAIVVTIVVALNVFVGGAIFLVATEAAGLAQGDVVGSRDTLVSPRHFDVISPMRV